MAERERGEEEREIGIEAGGVGMARCWRTIENGEMQLMGGDNCGDEGMEERCTRDWGEGTITMGGRKRRG